MKLYNREKYLSKIRGFYHDTELIKVITGVRRCGKSSLMLTIGEIERLRCKCGAYRRFRMRFRVEALPHGILVCAGGYDDSQ